MSSSNDYAWHMRVGQGCVKPVHEAKKGKPPMSATERITAVLTEAFRPTELQVIDESDRHKGHAGARLEGETHFRIVIASPAFSGVSRVEIHRRINRALAAEFADGLHALTIEARGSP